MWMLRVCTDIDKLFNKISYLREFNRKLNNKNI